MRRAIFVLMGLLLIGCDDRGTAATTQPTTSPSAANDPTAVATASNAVRERLAKDADFVAAKAEESRLLRELEGVRKKGSPAEKLKASSAWNKAHMKVVQIEKDTINGDPAVVKATMDQLRTADAVINSPINVAIREHRLIESMTYEQCVDAIGKPYSVTNSGDTSVVTWEVSRGDFWSAVFVDGKAASITHTRL